MASAAVETGSMNASNWTSLGVSLIALTGVILTNIWSDKRQVKQLKNARTDREADQKAADDRRRADQKAAEKQRQEDLEYAEAVRAQERVDRRADQEAADKRRQADQEAADKRRQADLEHAEAVRQQEREDRERERLEQIAREERERQRRAVATCLEKITVAAELTRELPTKEIMESHTPEGVERARTVKAIALSEFYQVSATALSVLDLELNDERVRGAAEELWELIAEAAEELRRAHDTSGEAWLEVADRSYALSDPVLKGIRKLQITARLFFLQYPDSVWPPKSAETST